MKPTLQTFVELVSKEADEMRDEITDVREKLGQIDAALNLSVSRIESITQRIEEAAALTSAHDAKRLSKNI